MEEVPGIVSLALGQCLAVGGAITALAFWRGAALSEARQAIASYREINQFAPLTSRDLWNLRLLWVQEALVIILFVLVVVTFINIDIIGENAAYFFGRENLDAGAADVAISRIVRASTDCLNASIAGLIPALVEWICASLIGSVITLPENGLAMELPERGRFRGRRYRDVVGLWRQRLKLLPLHAALKGSTCEKLIENGQLPQTWRSFAILVCRYRETASSDSGWRA